MEKVLDYVLFSFLDENQDLFLDVVLVIVAAGK